MGMPAVVERWTAEEVRWLPDDGNRYEVVHGELLVTPSPRRPHQVLIGLLLATLVPYLRRYDLGVALPAPSDIEFAPDTLVQPDICVAPLIEGRVSGDWRDVKELLLAIEVLSPRTERYDRVVKRKLYQQQGVGEYWIVDIGHRCVERWQPESAAPEIVTDVMEWQPRPDVPPLAIELAELFSYAAGDK